MGRLLFGRFSRYARFDTPGKPAKAGKPSRPGKTRADWWGRWGIAGGGVVITQLIHDLDLLWHLFGRASEVTAVIDTLTDRIESEDTCAATVRLESGALACCYASMTALRTSNAFDVVGEAASVHLPWSFECANTKHREQALRESLSLFPPAAPEPRRGIATSLLTRLRGTNAHAVPTATAHTPYVVDVLDAIAEGRPLPIGPDEARVSLDLCTAIYASAVTGHPITVPIDNTSQYYGGLTAADYDGRRCWSRQSAADGHLAQRAGGR